MTNWILLSTTAKAIIYSHDTKKDTYTIIKKFKNEQATKKETEIFSDRPGAATMSFASDLAGMEDRDSYENEVRHKFANEFMDYIEQARHFNKFDSILLVTIKGFAGHIRDNISTSLAEKVEGEILKNFYTEKVHELKKFLGPHSQAA